MLYTRQKTKQTSSIIKQITWPEGKCPYDVTTLLSDSFQSPSKHNTDEAAYREDHTILGLLACPKFRNFGTIPLVYRVFKKQC